MSSEPLVSIVMTTHNRAELLDSTLQSIFKQAFNNYEVVIVDDGNDADTPVLCGNYIKNFGRPIQYFRLNRKKNAGYNNPAYPNNVGLRQAKGEYVILQNAECRHANNEIIARFVAETGPNEAVFGQVETLNEYGMGMSFYCHRALGQGPRPFFFCGCLRREWFNKLRGFDEDYTYYGYDDVDFADRLVKAGVTFKFTDIEIQHQWHPISYNGADPNNSVPMMTYARKTREMNADLIGVERNLDKEWGAL